MSIYYGQDSDVGRFIIDNIPPWSLISVPTEDIVTNALSVEKESSITVTDIFDSSHLNDRIKLGIAEGNYTYNITYPITQQRDTLADAEFERDLLVDAGIEYIKKEISWEQIQPSISYMDESDGNPNNSSAYNWNIWGETPGEYDDIQMAIDAGFKVILTVHCNQRDSTFVTDEASGNFPTGLFGPLNNKTGMDCWKYFLQALVEKYGQENIYAWQIVNEADLNWKGSNSGPTSYGSLVKETKLHLDTLYAPDSSRLSVSLSSGNSSAQNFFYNGSLNSGVIQDARLPSGRLMFDILDIHLNDAVDLNEPNKHQFEGLLGLIYTLPGTELKFWSTELKISSTTTKSAGGRSFGGTTLDQARDIIKVCIERFSDGWDLILNSYLIDDVGGNGLLASNTQPYPGTIEKTSYEYFKEFSSIVSNSIYEQQQTYSSGGSDLTFWRFRSLGRRIFFGSGDIGNYSFPDYNWDQAVGGYLTDARSELTKAGNSFNVNYDVEDIFFIEQYETDPTKPNYLHVIKQSDRFRLQWETVASAGAYYVYKAAPGDSLTRLTTTANNYFEDTDIVEGNEYDYYVSAIDVAGAGTVDLEGTADDDQGQFTNSGLQFVEILITKGSTTDVYPAILRQPETHPWVWDYIWTPEEEGEYLIQSRATDNADNVETTPYSSRTVVVDITGPELFIDSPTDYFKTNTTVEIFGRAIDALSGVDLVRVWIDGEEYTVNTSDNYANWSVLYTPTADGVHLIEVRAIDLGGNESSGLWHIESDTTKPFVAAWILEGTILRQRDVTIKIIAEDNNNITGYLIKEGSDLPDLSDPGWVNIETPSSNINIEAGFTFSEEGGTS